MRGHRYFILLLKPGIGNDKSKNDSDWLAVELSSLISVDLIAKLMQLRLAFV